MSDLDTQADHALGLLKAGRFPEAIAGFEKLLEADPARGDDWKHFGYALHRLRRFDQALDAYRKALDNKAARPEEIRLNRAAIYAQHLSNPAAAKTELEELLSHDPEYGLGLARLGKVEEDLGDREAARAAYERALAVNPDDVFALARLTALTDFENADDPLLERLREIADDSARAPGARSAAGFALGGALDTLEQYGEAFAAYRGANEAARAEPGRGGYRPDLESRFTDRIIRAFATPDPRAAEPKAEKPIFVCGMFRSGSTLAERVLARHSRVTSGGELELVLAVVEQAFPRYPDDAAAAGEQHLAQLRSQYLAELEQIRPGAEFVTDKQPYNFRHIGLIKRLFPGAKFVDTVRNPLDNGLALYFAHLAPEVPFAIDLDRIVHWYRDYRRLMAHWKTLYPESIHTLDYDALVADPEPHIRALVNFCGLDWEESCLEPHKADTAVDTASAWQVRQPLYQSSSGRWRNYEEHIAPLIEAFPPDES